MEAVEADGGRHDRGVAYYRGGGGCGLWNTLALGLISDGSYNGVHIDTGGRKRFRCISVGYWAGVQGGTFHFSAGLEPFLAPFNFLFVFSQMDTLFSAGTFQIFLFEPCEGLDLRIKDGLFVLSWNRLFLPIVDSYSMSPTGAGYLLGTTTAIIRKR